MRVSLATAVALLLPACSLSLGQLSDRGQQSALDSADSSELDKLYKDFDADVQALLRGGASGDGGPLLSDAAADVLGESSEVQQDGQPPASLSPLELAASASAEDAPATDLAPELAVDAVAKAPLAEASPSAHNANAALPTEDDASAVVPEQASFPGVAAGLLASPSLDEAPPTVALEALPLVPGLPAGERRHTAGLVELNVTELATGINQEAPHNLDDVLVRTEEIAAVLAKDSAELALELGELKRSLKAGRAGAQRSLATEAAGSSGKRMKSEKSGRGWIQKLRSAVTFWR